MPPRPAESMPQHEVLLRLRAAIDTARRYPSQDTIDSAIELAVAHPQALRSGHLTHNLGQQRWEWLAEYGVYPAGEQATIAGNVGIKGTITPEVTK